MKKTGRKEWPIAEKNNLKVSVVELEYTVV
jgi:hypothetical protein